MQGSLYFFFERGEVLLNHFSNPNEIDAEIIMNQDIAEARDVPPIYRRVLCFQFLRQTLCGLCHHLLIPQDSVLGPRIGKEGGGTFSGILLDAFQAFADMD